MGNREYYINYDFDCDSTGIVYLIECKKCGKQYIGSTVTSFKKCFNNHKSSLFRYGRGRRGIPGVHLYVHFFGEGHRGLDDIIVTIIDKTDISKPAEREGFWVYKLDPFVPHELNLGDFTVL